MKMCRSRGAIGLGMCCNQYFLLMDRSRAGGLVVLQIATQMDRHCVHSMRHSRAYNRIAAGHRIGRRLALGARRSTITYKLSLTAATSGHAERPAASIMFRPRNPYRA